MTDKELDEKRLDDAVKTLSEHWDTVHVFVSRFEGGDDAGTHHAFRSYGSFYARYGQIRHWLLAEDEATREKARSQD